MILLLLRLLRRLLPPQHVCRHPDGCPIHVGPHQLLCVAHRAETLNPQEH